MVSDSPLLVLRRTWMLRILLLLFVLPPAILLCWGTIASLLPPEPELVVATICGGFGALFAASFWFFFRREMGRETRVYADRVEQRVGRRRTEIAWSSIREIWFEAVNVQAGGLVGAAVGAAVGALSKRTGRLDARTTNMTIQLVGAAGEKVVLSSNDRGVVEAFEQVLERVNPRLVSDAHRRVRDGQTVQFGELAVSLRGIALGRREPIGFSALENLTLSSGKLRIKKRGAWLDAHAIAIKKIPNLFALLEVCALLRGESPAPTGLDRRLAKSGAL